MMSRCWIIGAALGVPLALMAPPAHSAPTPMTFTLLTGVTGGAPAQTGVFQADLSGLSLGQIASVAIKDNSGGLGRRPSGQCCCHA